MATNAGSKLGVFIVAAKRTPFGSFGGKLKGHTAIDLAVVAANAALTSGGVDPVNVNSVVSGTVFATQPDAAFMARHVGLKSGLPVSTPCLTVNRLCGSGFQSIETARMEILLGESEVVLTTGSENLSQAPYVLRGARFGTRLGVDLKLEDSLWSALYDTHVDLAMSGTAEKLGEMYGVTRQQCDAFALQSQTRWKQANEAGYFEEELAPVELKSKKGVELFTVDEHPRDTTLETLANLPPVFKKNGLVTAGNASGICDGGSAVIIASEAACVKYNLTPLARVVDCCSAGVDPSIMGIGPVPAINGVLAKTALTLDDMDLVEVNEAFAPQALSVIQELGLDNDKTNVNGGAIAIGHPMGTSGNRIMAHLSYELRRRGGKYAVGSACIGGGQGIAMIIENVN